MIGSENMGSFAVPEEIRKHKPKGSMVKLLKGQYYVYEYTCIKDSSTGKWKTKMGDNIGKITIENGFIPNASYVDDDNYNVLEYGEYALTLHLTSNILDMLKKHFNILDALQIYYTAVIHFINSYVYLTDIKSIYDMSYLAFYDPNIHMSYESISKLLFNLGSKTERADNFQKELIKNSSKKIAIDGHAIASSSYENDLCEKGNKFKKLNSSQINLLMAYDVENNRTLCSKIYPGSELDKTCIKSLISQYELNKCLFIVDNGFYSADNIKLFTENERNYIIPLSPNLSLYKECTKDMNLKNRFVYGSGDDKKVIEYTEYKYNDKKVIVYRDILEAIIEQEDYKNNMRIDPEKYTEEGYNKVKDFFGVIVLQTALLNSTPQEIFCFYKKRWKIETFYNYLKNDMDFNNLKQEDYYKLQGLGFIMLIESLIYSEFKSKINNIKNTSIHKILIEARKIKMRKEMTKWVTSHVKKKTVDLLGELGFVVPSIVKPKVAPLPKDEDTANS